MQIGETIMLIAGSLVVYVLFLIWYGSYGKPVTTSEIDSCISRILSNRRAQNQQDDDILFRLRNMAEQDDGKSFYMVNLIQYKQTRSEDPSNDPVAANRRYRDNMLPILIKNGCHPVFLASVTSEFIKKGSEVNWDNVSIVRYRSMRDFLKVTTENSVRGVDVDKWLSIEKTQVFPVKATISLFFVRFSVAIVFALVILSVYIFQLN